MRKDILYNIWIIFGSNERSKFMTEYAQFNMRIFVDFCLTIYNNIKIDQKRKLTNHLLIFFF